MKAGTFNLNPYAESYIPLSKRGTSDVSKDFKIVPKECKSENEAVWHPEGALQYEHQYASQTHNVYSVDPHQASENFRLKGYPVHEHYGPSSQNLNQAMEKVVMEEELDMDLTFLQMTFPGISDDSISDVYMANKCDLEATVDMLNQLELYSNDSLEKLPDTLDIGDVSEAASSSASASQKLKEVTGKASSGPSSSGS